MPQTDQELLGRIAATDAAALSELYDRHSTLLYGMALTILKDTDLAEDILQEVFLQVWRKASQYQPELGAPKNWLVRIAHNRAINLLRSKRMRERSAEISIDNDTEGAISPTSFLRGEDDPLADVIRQFESESVSRALSGIAEDQRVLIELAFFQGYSHSEIAELTKLPLGTVKTRIRSGIRDLRASLGHLSKL